MEKKTVSIVVNGVAAEIELNLRAALESIIEKALHQTHNTGQPKENWELKDAAGNVLDLHRSFSDYGFSTDVKLYLNLKAGVGG